MSKHGHVTVKIGSLQIISVHISTSKRAVDNEALECHECIFYISVCNSKYHINTLECINGIKNSKHLN
jgi:hypothetical protein